MECKCILIIPLSSIFILLYLLFFCLCNTMKSDSSCIFFLLRKCALRHKLFYQVVLSPQCSEGLVLGTVRPAAKVRWSSWVNWGASIHARLPAALASRHRLIMIHDGPHVPNSFGLKTRSCPQGVDHSCFSGRGCTEDMQPK